MKQQDEQRDKDNEIDEIRASIDAKGYSFR